MAKDKFTGLSVEKLNEAMQSGEVRRALEARAARALPRTKALALSVGAVEFAKALRVSTGTRPGSGSREGLRRTYARITAEITPTMDKGKRLKMSRREILRRGAIG